MKPPKRVLLAWTGEGLAFDGHWTGERSGATVLVDSDTESGPGPMDHVLIGLGGCMGSDILVILEKGRVPVEALQIELLGERAPETPARFTRLRVEVRVAGPSEAQWPKVERAVRLSRETYCSVLHTLRGDLDIQWIVNRAAAGSTGS